MSTSDKRPEKSALERFFELGPAWISAIGAALVALTGAGFFAGHATADKSKPQPTVTVTETEAAGRVGAPQHPDGSDAPSMANGAQLGTYDFTMPAGVGAPLGPKAPGQDQLVQGGTGDFYEGGEGQGFGASSGNRLFQLADGSTPTYQACRATNRLAGQVKSTPGTAFCISATGRMIGLRVLEASSTQPFWVKLHVTVWQNTS
ncbi:hypothetical protein AB0L00_38295 [Actinoallomurus sp. NPDC052308]|uniref:hypothetical protein n=1 Tax=Actinoallomurus sp. NPDC052308 TaxID=3155530 RepID=UPI00343F44E0